MSKGSLSEQAPKEKTSIVCLPREAERHRYVSWPKNEYEARDSHLLEIVEHVTEANNQSNVEVSEYLQKQADTGDNHSLSDEFVFLHQQLFIFALSPIQIRLVHTSDMFLMRAL